MKTDPYWCFENYGEAAKYIDELEQEKSELVAALKEIVEPPKELTLFGLDRLRGIARAALAKVDQP